ncbi:MAG TPA: DUF4429 domain-containing protein [Gemmatimonadaceae bacterium]|nr:DUF4429 domain-containing protein [Gemmatimonadaceae bacterium]
MVDITLDGDRVRFEVQGWDKLWALKSELSIPLSQVRGVRIDPEAARGWFHGLRVPGTDIPHVITAGTFYQKDGWVFFDVHDPEKTIVLDLDHEHYKRMVIEVADPPAAVKLLEGAQRSAGAAR